MKPRAQGFKIATSSYGLEKALLPGANDFFEDGFEGACNIPIGVMRFHFTEVAVVADMISDAVLVDIGISLSFAGEFFNHGEGLQDRACVLFAAADVVNLPTARSGSEANDEAGDVFGVNIVAHLLTFIAENLVFTTLNVAADQITQEAVELDSRVIGSGQAATAKGASGHIEVAPIFLNHNIGGNFGGAKERVLGLIDRESFRDAVFESGIVVIPAGAEFLELDGVRTVAIDLVGGHMDEGGFGAGAAGGFEKVQRTDRVGIEIGEWDGCCAVVGRLGGSVDDDGGFDFRDEVEDAFAVADVKGDVLVGGDFLAQAVERPSCVAFGAEEDGAFVVVEANDSIVTAGEVEADFRADKTAGAGY